MDCLQSGTVQGHLPSTSQCLCGDSSVSFCITHSSIIQVGIQLYSYVFCIMEIHFLDQHKVLVVFLFTMSLFLPLFESLVQILHVTMIHFQHCHHLSSRYMTKPACFIPHFILFKDSSVSTYFGSGGMVLVGGQGRFLLVYQFFQKCKVLGFGPTMCIVLPNTILHMQPYISICGDWRVKQVHR